MSKEPKISALIQTWLEYIRWEDLTNSKVDAGDPEQPAIWEKGVSLVGDKLMLDESLFREFKQQEISLQNKGLTHSFQRAVAFPQIYIIEENRRKFQPLFTIDISDIFQGRYHRTGWDLTLFEFHPVLPNLIDLYCLDEESAESLVTREGLKVFLTTTFNHSFNTLQDFLQLVDLPPSPVRSKALPYLLRFDKAPYSYNLKKDLQKIRSQPDWDWTVTGHPAREYLFGQPQPPSESVMFLGAYPTKPPDEFQAAGLKHTQSHPITAVIGPPGSGKTTVLLHLIANQVTQRAVHLAQTGSDKSNLTFVTSTNNQAIQNVEERLAEKFPTSQFYLSGGRKELIAQSAIPKLQKAIDWLRSTPDNETDWEQALQQLLDAVAELERHRNQDQYYQQQRASDEQLQKKLEADIQALDAVGVSIDSPRPNQPPLKSAPDYSQFPIDAYRQIVSELDIAIARLPSAAASRRPQRSQSWFLRLRHWLTRLWQRMTLTDERSILSRLGKRIAIPVMATLATSFPFQVPLTRESLIAASESVSEQLKAATQWQQQQQNQTEVQIKLSSNQQERESLFIHLNQVQQRLASYPTSDFYHRFYSDYHSLQVQLFELSWQYLQQEALRCKDSVIRALEIYINVIAEEYDVDAFRQFARDWRNILRDLSLLFPVLCGTLQSLRNMLPYPDCGCIDRLIVDEAGMIPLHQAFPALVRCRSALVVGDPLQIEPVMTFTRQTLEQYRQTAFLEQGLSDEDYDRYSPTASYTATAYHRAAGASGRESDLSTGIILRNHYRSVAPIASYFSRYYPDGLIIKTQSDGAVVSKALIAYHVSGSELNQTNPEEIEAVKAIIDELIATDNLKLTIGVISPYRQQANALQQHLMERFSHLSAKDIGTVHTFQGAERDIIILSTLKCHPHHGLRFLNRRPNLLNVAVSRAKELFILVGNLERLKEGGYTRLLVEHIQQYGEIRQLP